MDAEARERVLVVDDEPETLLALEDVLSDQFSVLKTTSAEMALDTMASDPNVAVVVSDQRMPAMQGDELLSRCREKSDAARILLTGFADLPAVVRAINDGRIFAYVTKPWRPDDLVQKVRQAAEHFRLTRELAAERALLGSILDHMAEGVIVTDAAARILLLNREARRLLDVVDPTPSFDGWAETHGLYLSDRTTRLPPHLDPLRRARKGEQVRGVELFVKREETPGFSVVVTASPLPDESAEANGAVCLIRDVTEQRQLEQQLHHAQKMEAIGRLAGGVAHDFNNILAVVSGCASMLEEGCEDLDPRLEEIEQILAASDRAAALTKQLLTFSRQTTFQPRVIQLNDVIRSIEAMLRRIVGASVELRTCLSPSLHPIQADAGRIEQVLVNLTVNASDAMPEGGRLEITTQSVHLNRTRPRTLVDLQPGSYVRLTVSDTGVGMELETQTQIFEPFFTTKDVGRGTGLGLSTVYGIVRQCGGRILVESEKGRGSSFEVYFPCARKAPDASSPPPTRKVSPSGPATILVVDDETMVLTMTARMLRTNGYRAIAAASATEALSLLQGHVEIDVLLTDVVMPVMDGLALAHKALSLHPALPVVFMSGYLGQNDRGVLLHAHGRVHKPFTTAQLLEVIERALSTHRRAEA